MRLPAFKRFQRQDYPKKYEDLTDSLFASLNPVLESIILALSNRLSFPDNFNIYNAEFTVTAPIPASGFKIGNPQGGIFQGHLVQYCTNKNNPSENLSSAPFIQWTYSGNNQIVIQNITGLTSGNTYVIRAVFFR